MKNRYVEGFFYGLFMDPDVLIKADVEAVNPRRGYVEDFELRIGNRATLIAKHGNRAYGMVYSMTHDDVDKLYGQPGLEEYKPEAVQVLIESGGSCPALCYNLLTAPTADEANPRYAELLRAALTRLEFPDEYIRQIT